MEKKEQQKPQERSPIPKEEQKKFESRQNYLLDAFNLLLEKAVNKITQGTESQMHNLESRINLRIQSVENKVDGVEQRLTSRINAIQDHIKNREQQENQRFLAIVNVLNEREKSLKQSVENIRKEVSDLKAAVNNQGCQLAVALQQNFQRLDQDIRGLLVAAITFTEQFNYWHTKVTQSGKNYVGQLSLDKTRIRGLENELVKVKRELRRLKGTDARNWTSRIKELAKGKKIEEIWTEK